MNIGSQLEVPSYGNEKAKTGADFSATWHICEMDLCSEDYLSIETQAYLQINPDNLGQFQFGNGPRGAACSC
jgi:hypothetical protein